jgi:hypothetical protein
MMLWMDTPSVRPRLTIAALMACDCVRVGSEAMKAVARAAIVAVVVMAEVSCGVCTYYNSYLAYMPSVYTLNY